ncbi:hypothetical protein [Marinobacter confluentis]|uniref:Outer membrane protein assembly factor BamE n=1 Tax=Marinobacter confluentis TaxID=1697557 RepID=A0A4Z1C750_9GAMM|nr:hypothetical protein [Marinobacter confluentis]TGN41440.1 hypothetical protein E5Q11_02560 [Marinobacter confluentis]
MKKRTLQALCAATVVGFMLTPLSAAVAEELRMSLKDQAQRSAQEDLPRNGLSESSVENRWGQPQSVTGPVGDPPIYQWHYQNFTVYFEGNRVIHSVLSQDR